jgi:hypothetical protein
MFIIRTVDYNSDGHREDRLAYEMVFESREDAQHKASNDNEAEITHIHAMRCITHRQWMYLHPGQPEPTREEIAAEFSGFSVGFNYVEEWEFQPSTCKAAEERERFAGVADTFNLTEHGVRPSQDTPGLGGVPLIDYLGTDLVPTVAPGYYEHVKRVAGIIEDQANTIVVDSEVGRTAAADALAESGGSIHDDIEDGRSFSPEVSPWATQCRCGVAGHLNEDGTRKDPLPCE